LLDPNDKQKFRLVVRSSREVPHMTKCDAEAEQALYDCGIENLAADVVVSIPAAGAGSAGTGTGTGTSTPSSSSPKTAAAAAPAAAAAAAAPLPPPPKFPVHKLEAARFLKPRPKMHYWQLTLRVDNEQACSLAAQHIHAKRRDFLSAKLQELKALLERWGSESLDVLNDA
jgi:hypothetical protein